VVLRAELITGRERVLTLWRARLPYGYSYKAHRARPG